MSSPGAEGRWSIQSWAAVAAICVAPPLACVVLWRDWKSAAAGAAVWALSVTVKYAIAIFLTPRLRTRLSTKTIAVFHGALSAVTELGATLLFFFYAWPITLTQAVAFGVGAGSVEAAYVFIVGVFLSEDDPQESSEWAAGAADSYCVRYMVPIERGSALLGHISSRGLIYVGLAAPTYAAQASLIAIAFLLFSCVDGVAAYGILKRWNWYDPKICFRAHLFFFSISVIESVLFLGSANFVLG
ncbi:MAG: hypothetical protein HZB28_08225 [Methylocystis sp.]|nr:hypothetical protein [Methylocystis sp.]